MASVKDPVCGMMIDSNTAADRSTYRGVTYYFCSVDCRRAFDKEPKQYARAADEQPA